MRKIVFLLIFLINSLFIFSEEKSISIIKTLTMKVEETILLNSQKKKSEYTLKFIKPNFLRKDVISPELNKGEIYIYNDGKKIVYLPLFDQVSEEESKEGTEILETINYLFEKEQKDKNFKKEYYSKKLNEILLEDGTKIKIDNFKKYDGYLLPQKFDIFTNEGHIGTLYIKEYIVNQKLSKEELSKYD